MDYITYRKVVLDPIMNSYTELSVLNNPRHGAITILNNIGAGLFVNFDDEIVYEWKCSNNQHIRLAHWGKSTAIRNNLIEAIRRWWIQNWFEKDIPAIRIIFMERTILPFDVIQEITDYLPFPYQTKKI
jgi:hypothetical protein